MKKAAPTPTASKQKPSGVKKATGQATTTGQMPPLSTEKLPAPPPLARGKSSSPQTGQKVPLPTSTPNRSATGRTPGSTTSRTTPRTNSTTPLQGGSRNQQALPPRNIPLNPPNPVPKPVQEAVQYVEAVGSAIIHKVPVQPPPTSLLDMKEPVAIPATPVAASSARATPSSSDQQSSSGPATDRGSKPKPMNPASIAKEDSFESTHVAIPLSLQGLAGNSNSFSSTNAPGSSPRGGGLPLATLGLLRQLHVNTNKLIQWYQKVEGGTTSGAGGSATVDKIATATMEEAEHCIQMHSSEVISTVVGLSKQLKTWPDKHVITFMGLKSTNNLFEDCKKSVAALHASATIITSVRRVVRERDLGRARAIVADYAIPAPPPSSQGSESGISPARNPRTVSRSGNSVGGVAGTVSPGFGGSFGPVAFNGSIGPGGHFPLPTSTPRGNSPVVHTDWMNATGGTAGSNTPTMHTGGGGYSQQKPMAPPLVTWLYRFWLPAMEQWASMLRMTKYASESDDVDAMKDCITNVRTQVVTRGSLLQEILLPGETLTDLVERQIETPLEKMMVDTAQRKEVLGGLAVAVKAGDISTLGSRIRAAEGVELRTEEEKKLVAEGQQLLIDLQRIAKVTVTLSIAQRSGDLMTLVRALNAANSLIFSMGLAPDRNQCEAAVKEGAKILSQPIANSSLILSMVQPDVLIVDHLPSQAWASELSDLYAVVAKRLAQLFEQHQVRKSVAQQLPSIRGATTTAKKNSKAKGGPDDDHADSVSKAAQRAKQLLAQCKAAGISGPELDELTSIVAASTEIQIKVHYDSDLRLIAIPEQSCRHSFSTVVEHIRKACKPAPRLLAATNYEQNGGLRVRYQDDDGDFILVESQADWELLLRNFTHSDSFAAAKVEIYVDVPTPKPASGDRDRIASRGRQPTPPRQPTPVQHTKKSAPLLPVPVAGAGRAAGGASTNTGKRPAPFRSNAEPESGASWIPQVESLSPTKEPGAGGSSVSPMRTSDLKVPGPGGKAAAGGVKGRRGSNTEPIGATFKPKPKPTPHSDEWGAKPIENSPSKSGTLKMKPHLTVTKKPEGSSGPGQWAIPEDLDIHTVASEETTVSDVRQRNELQNQLSALKRKQNGAGGVLKENGAKKSANNGTSNHNERIAGRPQLKPSVRKGPTVAPGGAKPLYGSAAVGSELELIGRRAK